MARFGTRVPVSRWYTVEASSVVCARTYIHTYIRTYVRTYVHRTRSAWTSKASREEVALGSGNDGANSAITEARTPRGFGTRLDRPLLEYSRSIVFSFGESMKTQATIGLAPISIAQNFFQKFFLNFVGI